MSSFSMAQGMGCGSWRDRVGLEGRLGVRTSIVLGVVCRLQGKRRRIHGIGAALVSSGRGDIIVLFAFLISRRSWMLCLLLRGETGSRRMGCPEARNPETQKGSATEGFLSFGFPD